MPHVVDVLVEENLSEGTHLELLFCYLVMVPRFNYYYKNWDICCSSLMEGRWLICISCFHLGHFMR